MTTSAELADAVKACYEESDGITVWMSSELAQALYAHLVAQPAAPAVVELTTDEIAKCLRTAMPRTKCTAGYIAFARAVLAAAKGKK
jgi:hypothetical protein